VAPHLDRIAEELAGFGYQVSRMPFLFLPRPPPGASGSESSGGEPTEETDAVYPCLTYNNVLLETAPDTRLVYLPQYGWPSMDQAAREAWQESGFDIVPVEGLAVSAIHGGSLRCCVKVLARTPPSHRQ
jgi:hypothetical protein